MPTAPCIYCLGLNHTSASIELRERLVFNQDDTPKVLLDLESNGASIVSELVVISTCNRIELYGCADRDISGNLEAILCNLTGVSSSDLQGCLYVHSGLEAARHVYEVAAGLDSQVLGEAQILGQISHALETARAQGTAGPVLNRLFQAAVHAGKRARAETTIGRSHTSVASLAVSVLENTLGELGGRNVVILGAGEMAELAIEALHRRGARKITIINRTLEHAGRLAARWDGEAAGLDTLPNVLRTAEAVIASTSAGHTLISAAMLRDKLPREPLLLMDIAMPRNIDPACADLPGVKLFDLEALNTALEQGLAGRLSQVPQVQAILAGELEQFSQYLESRQVLPLIGELYRQAENMRRTELEKTLRHLPPLNEAERLRIDALTQALVNKLLENPTRRLRAEAAGPDASQYAATARSLFGLTNDAPPSS